MLQNISGNFEAVQNDVEEKINYKEILKHLFSIHNVVIYLLSFMISMTSFGNYSSMMIMPFGIALVAAAISNGVPIAVVYLSSLLGTLIRFGGKVSVAYLAVSAVLLIAILIKKPVRNEEETEQLKLGGYLFFAVLFTSIVKMFFTNFLVYDLMVACVLAVSSYVFYKIFVNSLEVISKYRIKTVFSIEEIIGASLLITIALSAIGDFSIFTFSIRNILCIFLVLMLGWRNGVLVGGVSGITVGIVLGIIGTGNPILIATYSICGMLAGLLNRFGKIGVIVGFILGNIIVAYSANGGVSNIIMFQEILIAAVGLLVLPKKTFINIEDILPNTKLLPEATGRLEESSETLLKLNSISQTINEMSKNHKQETTYESNVELYEHQVLKEIEKLEENILFDYFSENEDNLIQDIFDYLTENRVLTENALISILAKHNVYLMNSDNDESNAGEKEQVKEMIKALNIAFSECKSDIIWQKKLDEKSKNISSELENVKAAIDNITDEITNSSKEFSKHAEEENKIKKALFDSRISVKDVKVKQEISGRYIVKAYTNICDDLAGKNCPVKTIRKEISNVLKDRFSVQDQKCGIRMKEDTCEYTYISDDKFLLQTGIAKAKKDGTIVSGDCISQTRLGDGKYLLAISDGMGTGPDARRNSKIAISMLERLLNSGFEKETSINLINSAILNANKEEMYATLDIEVLDLFAGKVEFLKNGACPTYIKRNRNVSIIKSDSLPTGIMQNVRIDTYDKDLKDGDILVICSDGILESNTAYANKEIWLKGLLEDIQTDIPEKIADIILKEAVDNYMGKPKDDMSIIVAKVIKKQ